MDARKQALAALANGSSPRTRYLMQSPEDPTRWEALDYRSDEPHQFDRRTLDTAQAAQWQRDGGFEILSPERFTGELRKVSDATTAHRRDMDAYNAKRAAQATDSVMVRDPMTTDVTRVLRSKVPEGAQVLDDGTGATLQRWREEELAADDAAYESARKADGATVLAGLEGGKRPFRGPSEADLADLDAQQERFQQTLRLSGQPAPARGGSTRRPQVDVAKVGGAGAMPAAQTMASRGPANEQEGRSVNAAGRDTTSKGPGDDEFAQAQAEADNRRLAVALGRAGAQVGAAISGGGYDAGAYDALSKEADSPVRRLLAQRDADRKKALEDPSSEQSRRVQAAVAKAMPGVYAPEELAGITAADADMVTKYGAMRQRLEERKADLAREEVQRAAALERDDMLRAEDRAFQQQQAGASRAFQAGESAKGRAFQREMAGINNAADLERARLSAAGGAGGLEKDIQKVGEALEGAAPLKGDLSFLDRMAAEKDVPGVGKWDSRKTGLLSGFASDDDTRTIQTMRGVVGRLLKERSGMAASDAEVDRVMTELGMGPGASEQEFRVGLGRLRQDVAAALTAKEARFRPEVVEQYRQRGGTTSRDIAAPQSQSDMVPMVDPQGRQRMVPRARVQDALAAGGRLVNG